MGTIASVKLVYGVICGEEYRNRKDMTDEDEYWEALEALELRDVELMTYGNCYHEYPVIGVQVSGSGSEASPVLLNPELEKPDQEVLDEIRKVCDHFNVPFRPNWYIITYCY